jgi:hypothetical protein
MKQRLQKITSKLKGQSFKDIIRGGFRWLKTNWPAIQKKATSTEGIKYGIGGLVVIFLLFMIVQSCTPRKGTLLYGICRSFLELHIPYPDTIYHARVEQYRKALRIYYNHLDSYGQYQREMIECSFVQDPVKGLQVEAIYIDSIKPITQKERAPGKGRLYQVEQEYIDRFNVSMSPSAIMSQDPDLELPVPEWRAIDY